jgi:glycosyltransferase involved in cell wall biosynthesis
LRNPREKGAIYAIHAAEIIHNSNKNLRIVSYGDYSGEIPKFIQHLGIVDFLNLIKLYRESDIFILPSLSEGFSLPGLEAMASGCAVISTKNGGSDQYIIDGFNGLLVEKKNSKALADAVLKLANDPLLLKTFITNGQKIVMEYTYEKAAQRFINILREIDNFK